MNDHPKSANGSLQSPMLLRAIGGALVAALFTMMLFTYQNVAMITQYITDHKHHHDLEETNCAAYREAVRREFDMLWDKLQHLHAEGEI